MNRQRQRSSPNDFYDILESPLGSLYLIFTAGVLSGVVFSKPAGPLMKQKEGMTPARKELAEYFEKGRREFTCETVFLGGTEFERKVWRALRQIPYGETRTYKWLAGVIGKPAASRAVGNALGKNPIPIIFPCHRVIESDGSIGGYSSGIEIKRRLLEIEYYAG